ncbi:MAG: hypothetical protein ACPHJE_06195, partial [Poseidonia sp.]
MKPLYEQHRVRYPPFEAARWESSELPVAKHRYEIGQYASKGDAVKDLRKPSFCLGGEDGWLIERTFVFDEEEVVPAHEDTVLEDAGFVRLVKRQRRGWYL